MQQFSVSVVIPCYNGASFLRETLESVLAQTCRPLEVIVVDDGSTDDSADIAASFGPPVRVIRQPNQGESIARNRGIDEAQGEWIAFLDADDRWEPTKLERQAAHMAPDVACIHTEFYYFGAQQGVGGAGTIPASERYSRVSFATRFPILMSSTIVPRRIHCRFPSWTRRGEDMLFFLDLADEGRFCLVNEPLTGYRRTGVTQSASVDNCVQWHATLWQWLEENKQRVPAAEIDAIREAAAGKLDFDLRMARWAREWPAHALLREYISSNPQLAANSQAIHDRVLPPWCYAIKDRLDGWRKS